MVDKPLGQKLAERLMEAAGKQAKVDTIEKVLDDASHTLLALMIAFPSVTREDVIDGVTERLRDYEADARKEGFLK